MSDEFKGKTPKTEKLTKFFQLVAAHQNKERAAREAGYSEAWARCRMHQYVREYQPFLHWLQGQHSKAVAKHITVTKQSVIDELAKVAFANPQDYVKRKPGSPDNAPLFEQIPIDKLPRDMAAAIGSFTIDKEGKMTYSLLRKTPELLMLAKSMGLASEKLIVQHNHAHLHARMDLSEVPSEALDQVEKLLTKSGAKVYENGEGSES